ncbi:MAG: hypothetical protein JW751_16720 [Polyangiaceae bacterium]|nr:hypothetical protein [Polyangiaceae bacterium]
MASIAERLALAPVVTAGGAALVPAVVSVVFGGSRDHMTMQIETSPSRQNERWLLAAEVCLAIVGGCYLLFALGGLAAAVVVPFTELPQQDAGAWVLVGYGALLCVIGVALTALNFAAMVGVRRRTKWGYVLGLGLAVLYLPSGCLPFGIVIGWALFQEPNRKTFGF